MSPRPTLGFATLPGLAVAVACGSDDDTGLTGSGGATTGSTGGATTGGSGGGNTGGSGGGSAGCPPTAPTPGTPCPVAGAVCCYGPAPTKPLRCVPAAPDGGGPYHWATLQSKVCCPASAPAVGTPCNAPGDLECCYPSGGFRCDNQPPPDVWATTVCN